MSPLIRNNIDPSNPLYYAPPRMRQPIVEPRPERSEDEGALVPSGGGPTPVRLGAPPEDQPRRQSRIFEDDLRNSERVTYERWRERPMQERLLEGLSSLLGPEL